MIALGRDWDKAARRHPQERRPIEAMCGTTRVRRGQLSGLELGQRDPTVVTLWHAAQALEIEVHLLLKKAG